MPLSSGVPQPHPPLKTPKTSPPASTPGPMPPSSGVPLHLSLIHIYADIYDLTDQPAGVFIIAFQLTFYTDWKLFDNRCIYFFRFFCCKSGFYKFIRLFVSGNKMCIRDRQYFVNTMNIFPTQLSEKPYFYHPTDFRPRQ